MEFRDLKRQYTKLKPMIDKAVGEVFTDAEFISGKQIANLEHCLASYVGVKHCITCGNGTDALLLALMAWNIGKGDAVFVPNFTFFASGEVVSFVGATPIFVDVEEDTYNISYSSLEKAIQKVLIEQKLTPKVIIAVDLFGQPANYKELQKIADTYNLLILEDAAQGFGGAIGDDKGCSFGDIAATSFFPAKPLGCYGDGGAIFTNNDHWAELIRSYSVHGKGNNKYDNIRIGMNSRLDTVQAAILQIKLEAFKKNELEAINKCAKQYEYMLSPIVKTPKVLENYLSSWAQYTICLKNREERDKLKDYLEKNNIPTMIYYSIPMHKQKAFKNVPCHLVDLTKSEKLCDRVLSLPIHPYLREDEVIKVCEVIKQFYGYNK